MPMNASAALFSAAVLLCGLDAVAEETVPPEDAGVVGGDVSTEETTAPAERIAIPSAPAVAQTQDAAPEGPPPVVLTKEERRRLAQQIQGEITVREGTDAPDSAALGIGGKGRSFGVPLIVLGAASILGGIVWGVFCLVDGVSNRDYYEETDFDGKRRFLSGFLPLMLGGAVAVGVGIPLAVSGRHAEHRRRHLDRRREKPATPPPTAASATLALFADPARGGGGLLLNVTF